MRLWSRVTSHVLVGSSKKLTIVHIHVHTCEDRTDLMKVMLIKFVVNLYTNLRHEQVAFCKICLVK